MPMTDTEDEFPYKSHVWKAIGGFSHDVGLLKERLKMIEAVVERQNEFALNEISRYDALRNENAKTNRAGVDGAGT